MEIPQIPQSLTYPGLVVIIPRLQSSGALSLGTVLGGRMSQSALFLGFDRTNPHPSNRSEEQKKTKTNKNFALNYSNLMSVGLIHFFCFLRNFLIV